MDSSAAWVWLVPLVAVVGGLFVGIHIVRRRSKLVDTDDSAVEAEDTTR
jgi:hypothetical protein